jgi:opacity protein-like surface antigen
MNIKSLLIGAASAMTIASGAQAADAIVVADPEPMEYVRICDVYGVGFFYIPGTETCLKIGGYMRYEIRTGVDTAAGFTKRARFAPNFDVRSDTSIGTLRGYAEIEIDWDFGTRPGIVAGAVAPVAGMGTDVNPLHVYIEVIRPNGGAWRFGVTESPYTRFLGYGTPTMNDGYYSYRQTSEISYTFTGSNGLGFIAALVEDQSGNFVPDAELGLSFGRGWGSIGAMVGLDPDAAGGFSFGAKANLQINFGSSGSFLKIMPMFTNNAASAYGFGDGASTLSVLAGLNIAFNQKVSLGIGAQWLNSGTFVANLSLPITVAENFVITPEVGFDGPGVNVVGPIYGLVRLNRSF